MTKRDDFMRAQKKSFMQQVREDAEAFAQFPKWKRDAMLADVLSTGAAQSEEDR